MTALASFGISSPFNQPFFTGETSRSDEIPGLYPVGLNGRGFLLDLKSGEYRHESVPLLRQQADQSDEPGESSVNPEDLWRRSVTSWHLGAGQRALDASEPTIGRFWRSQGVDPWTQGELSLLPATDQKKVSANFLGFAVAGSFLYLLDGASIQHTEDITVPTPVWDDITGEPATAGSAITSDGYSIWSAHGADGVYLTTRGAAATASSFTGTVTGVKYLKGRLFAWNADKLYNLITPGAIPAALLDHPNTDFDWVDVAEAAGFYFPAGVSGDRSTIYRTAVQADGTGLEVPVVAAELPDGEIIRSVHGYLGFLLIGTNKGIRFGVPDASGNLTLGALISQVTEVRCFEGQGDFVWFGWSQLTADTSGLGRLDLGNFNGTKPAYASDLMADADGDVTAVATFQGRRVFAVSGDGVYAEEATKVATGFVELGRITYGIYDTKVSMFLNVNHLPLAGTVSAEMSRDGGDYAAIGVPQSTPGTVRSDFATNRGRAQAFDIRITLAPNEAATDGPTLTLATLRAYPSASRTERITLPLLLGKNQQTPIGSVRARNIIDDLEFLAALEADGAPILLQEGMQTSVVVLEDHQWRPHHYEKDAGAFNGTYLVSLKRFASE